MPEDFVKALCLGADGVAIASSAMQAIGCVAARICHTGNCPSGVATQKAGLRARLNVEGAAERLDRYLRASVDSMAVLARACGHGHLSAFTKSDLATWKKEISELTGFEYAGHLPGR